MEQSSKKVTKFDIATALLELIDIGDYYGLTPAQCPVCHRWHAMYSVMRRHLMYKHNKADLMNTYLRLLLEQD